MDAATRRFLIAILTGTLALLALGSALVAQAAESFVAPAKPSGTISVTLRPTEIVLPGQNVLVTFGVPFPRGSITASDLATVRVSKGGTEIPAHVEMLTPWRHATNPALDGTSVRVARIQIHYAFAAAYPAGETITVEWGLTPRSLDVAVLVDPRSAWHLVTDGTTKTGGQTFGAANGVYEPDVYAVLPKAWLSSSGLKTRMQPMDDSVAEARIPPAQVASSYPAYQEADHAQINFFYTIINDDDPLVGGVTANNTNPFVGGDAGEPWLYDRAMAMYVAYLRSGHFRLLREAVRNTDYYRRQVWIPSDCNNGGCVGSFKLKNPDPAVWQDEKYSYNESFATSYWLTGDPAVLPYIDYVPRIYAGVPTNANMFTERHAGFKLLANVVAYEVTGTASYRTTMQTILQDFRNGQVNTYMGVTPDGGIWHSVGRHEGDDSADPITSPWMSALIADGVARAYLVTDSSTAADFLKGLANHECGNGSYMTTIRDGENPLEDFSGGAPLRFPHYLATPDGLGVTSEFNPYNDFEHSYEVGATVAWGAYFEGVSGNAAKQAQLKTCANELYTSFSHAVTNWTRPSSIALNYDGYRNTPFRKYSWWFKNSSGFAWAMAQTGTIGGGTPTPTTGATPTSSPTVTPTTRPTPTPTLRPTATPTSTQTQTPTVRPTSRPTPQPTVRPRVRPTTRPTVRPRPRPTARPTVRPRPRPTARPTARPRPRPRATVRPTARPTARPTTRPTARPTLPPAACGVSTPDSIFNQAFASRTGVFTVSLDAIPTAVNGELEDTGVGINQAPPVGEANSFQTATTVRFYVPNGHIEARSDLTYPATNIPWTAGQTYRLRLVVNVPAHTYSAYVTAPGGAEQTIGTGLAFRNNYATAAMLNNVRGAVDGGSIQICNVVVTP